MLRVLQQFGLKNVVIAADGQLALENVKMSVPDVIFMDICMPLVREANLKADNICIRSNLTFSLLLVGWH